MSGRTIGEVLNRLKDEFDDITISKIRFLESEGLISPDRTESGYRKFTDQDVDRLRYVLRAQRDRYLPLKVIKQELDERDARGLGFASGPPDDLPPSLLDPEPEVDGDVAASPDGGHPGTAGSVLDEPAVPPPLRLSAAAGAEVHLSAQELCETADITPDLLGELREHGLLGSGPGYDADDLRVARIAAQLLGRGLEVRHLRMYRQFADREASLVEQLVTPLLRQRNPDSHARALEQAEHLAAAGGALYQALLAKQLRGSLHS